MRRIVVPVLFLAALGSGGTVATDTPPPTTCQEVWAQAARVPWGDPVGLFSDSWARCAEQRWGARWGFGCMHPTDHQYAIRVMTGLEPSLLDVEISWRAGCDIVWQARCKTKERDPATGRPSDWDRLAAGSKMIEVLSFLAERRLGSCVKSIPAAMKIFDGKSRDPEPQRTAALYAEWSGAPMPPPPPPAPLPDDGGPIPAPTCEVAVKVIEASTGRITLTLAVPPCVQEPPQ